MRHCACGRLFAPISTVVAAHIRAAQHLGHKIQLEREALGENCPQGLGAQADSVVQDDPIAIRGWAPESYLSSTSQGLSLEPGLVV
jgi:hypothetical protein